MTPLEKLAAPIPGVDAFLLTFRDETVQELARVLSVPTRFFTEYRWPSSVPQVEAQLEHYYATMERLFSRAGRRAAYRNRGTLTRLRRRVSPRKARGFRRHIRRIKARGR